MNTRQFIIAVALAVVVLCLGAVGWKLYGPSNEKPVDPSVDLMTPSPLGERSLGRPDAPVTIIEYASMTCPHCAKFHEATFPELKTRYIDTGKVRFIFREFPFDPVALAAFVVARCNDEDKYFATIAALFKEQDKWAVGPPASPIPPLMESAKRMGISEEQFKACIKDQKLIDGVNWSLDRGTKLQVKSTPTFFINGAKQSGAFSIEDMAGFIDPLLKPAG